MAEAKNKKLGAATHAALCVCCLFFVSAGCRREAVNPAGGRAAPVASTARIICGTPAMAELVFALGCGDRVVGISDYTVWPPEAMKKPSIGGWVNPDRERLMVLRPDIILTQGMHERLASFAEKMGVRFYSASLDGYDEVLAQMVSLGSLLGVAERGTALRARVEGELAAVQSSVANAAPRRVVVLFSREEGDMTSLTAIGPSSFLHQLIEIAGGINIFSDARGDYPQVSKESLLVRSPEVIIELHAKPMADSRPRQIKKDWQIFDMLPAVKNDRIYVLTDEFLLIPGPRMALTARRFAEAIHPECFHE